MANTVPPSGAQAAGPAEGLEEVFARCQGELYGTLLYLVGNEQDARDAFQDTFVKCWRNRQQIAEIRNLRAWVFRIAMNTARDLRKTAWRRRRQGLPADAQMLRATTVEPLELVERQEEASLLRQAIQTLRPEEKEVFLLRQNGELTYEEIAEMLRMPIGTVKTRMRMALQNLRAVVQPA